MSLKLFNKELKHREIAEQHCGEPCRLKIDGKEYEAKVAGRLNRFATISPLNSAIPGVEFSWDTVELIMSHDKLFRS